MRVCAGAEPGDVYAQTPSPALGPSALLKSNPQCATPRSLSPKILQLSVLVDRLGLLQCLCLAAWHPWVCTGIRPVGPRCADRLSTCWAELSPLTVHVQAGVRPERSGAAGRGTRSTTPLWWPCSPTAHSAPARPSWLRMSWPTSRPPMPTLTTSEQPGDGRCLLERAPAACACIPSWAFGQFARQSTLYVLANLLIA